MWISVQRLRGWGLKPAAWVCILALQCKLRPNIWTLYASIFSCEKKIGLIIVPIEWKCGEIMWVNICEVLRTVLDIYKHNLSTSYNGDNDDHHDGGNGARTQSNHAWSHITLKCSYWRVNKHLFFKSFWVCFFYYLQLICHHVQTRLSSLWVFYQYCWKTTTLWFSQKNLVLVQVLFYLRSTWFQKALQH